MSYTIISNASELATNTGNKAAEGAAMGKLLTLEDAALIFRDDTILFVGTTQDAKAWLDEHLTAEDDLRTLDATGKTVIPGFIDPHTHIVFGGFRDDEFNRRLAGATYMEIMDMGGGIQATNRATKNATEDELFDAGIKRLERMLNLGITTVEGKTGYGEGTETEDKMLRVMERLDKGHPVDIVMTYMGAHAVPPRFKGRTGDYVDYLIEEGLPMAQGRAKF